MFAEKLGKLLKSIIRSQPKYITASVTPEGIVTDKQLPPTADPQPPEHVPRHVAIIMDGNGRWAQQRGMGRSAGHAAGTEALRDIIRASDDWGVKSLSIYAFSTENWARSKEEVGALMGLLLKYFTSEIDELCEKNVHILILGDVNGLPEAQRDAVNRAMERTKDNTGLNLNIALNYGGHAELTRAAKLIAQDVADGKLSVEDINDSVLESHLYTAGQANVDLLIRTSGEMRTSNFLPWQLAYAEMIFDPVMWPDFDRAHYANDLRIFASRNRRFGGVEAKAQEEKN